MRKGASDERAEETYLLGNPVLKTPEAVKTTLLDGCQLLQKQHLAQAHYAHLLYKQSQAGR